MDPFALSLVLSAAVGFAIARLHRSSTDRDTHTIVDAEIQQPHRVGMLEELAARYGGVGTDYGMTARLGACEVAVELRLSSNLSVEWTLVVARPAFPEFKVQRRRLLDMVFAGNTFELGDEDFDGHFTVIGDDPVAVQGLWTRELMTRMLDMFPSGYLTSKRQKLILRGEIPSTIEIAVTGVEILRTLASPDVHGLAALRALPDAEVERGEAVFPDGVRVGPLVIEGQAITRASATSAADVAWRFEVVDGKATGPGLERLPIDVRARVSALGTASVSSNEGDAQVRWKTIETDHDRLVAAIEILRSLARGPSLGAFR